jgi:XTP/dITP diphosphohydrolase
VPGTLVVLSPRLGAVLPAAALPALRAAEHLYADPTVPEPLAAELGATAVAEAPTPGPGRVLFTLDPDHPDRRHWDVVDTPDPPGAALLDAVAVMDRLRSPGGCPWDAEQTHTSLLQYLVEECYELHQAIEDADRPALREELGDVLLQVLFHARLAAEGGVKPFASGVEQFTVDDVAGELVAKLVGRHPHVFGAGERVDTASDQELRWDELKRAEKSRESALDGVALGQPAVALVAKLVSRARKAGLPESLVYAAAPEVAAGDRALFDAVVAAKLAGGDPEQQLRDAARSFDRTVRAAEGNARAAGWDSHRLTEQQWSESWPT